MSPIEVQVRLFAVLRERSGRDRLELQLAEGSTVGDALSAVAELGSLGELLDRLPLRIAVNREYATASTVLRGGDELALIPPVSGGSGDRRAGAASTPRVHVRITAEPLSPDGLLELVADPRAGALVTFTGVTREVDRLEYEAYTEMAGERIEAILHECVAAHELWAAAAEHRVGSVALGEPSVTIAVSAAHREQAFAGAREAIDRIKAEAPIWKREHPAGEPPRWVGGIEPAG